EHRNPHCGARGGGGHRSGGLDPGGAPLARPRLERPDQPHGLRHLRAAEAVRLQQGQGHEADARRPPQGPGRCELGLTRAVRDGRLPAPRARPLGDHGAERV
ncbi:MAG: ATP-dependent Clp protease adaptor protein ClpS, partial [uncultured Acidimicrobiales bacterium]